MQETTITEKIVTTLKEDGKLVVRRTAARKVTKLARDMIVSFLTVGKTKKEANSIRASVGAFLETDNGRAVLGIMIGSFAPQFKNQLPEKYHQTLLEMSQEFRVEGMSHFTDFLTEFMTGPAFNAGKALLMSTLDEAMNGDVITGVRVDTSVSSLPKPEQSLQEVVNSNTNNSSVLKTK